MKRFLQILLSTIISVLLIYCVACDITTTGDVTDDETKQEQEDKSEQEESGDSGEEEGEETHYTVTFVTDENVSVYVYNTQDMSGEGTLSTTALSRDSESGEELTDGNGQVNFILKFADGYELDSMTGDQNYNKIKGSADTGYTNGYRITKITGDVTVTITSKQQSEEKEEGEETHYTVTFVTDENVSVYVYNTQDMSGEGTLSTTALSRDSATGEELTDGNGQVNFILKFTDGYMLNSISGDKNYNNLKDPSETGYTNGYRITKITGDVTVTITSMEKVDGFTVTFNYDTTIEGLEVLVYDTKDYTGEYTTYSNDLAIYAKTEDGVITTDAGLKPQVNFKVVLPEGYVIDTITASEGLYSNIKTPTDTGADNTYRITKVTGNIEITITVKLEASESKLCLDVNNAECDTSAFLNTTYGVNWQSLVTGYLKDNNNNKVKVNLEYSEQPINAGEYTITVSYEDYTPITLNLTIEKATITIPTNTFDTLLYTGEELEFFPEGYDEYLMEITGNTGTNSGTYTAVVSILDTTNYMWSDSTSLAKEYTWYINSNIVLTEPTANTNVYTYNGEQQTYYPTGYNESYMTISNNVQKEVGLYTVVVSLKDSINYSWVGGGSEDKTFTFVISKTLLEKPTQSTTNYTYTGKEQTYIPLGYDENTMSITGNVATNVANYTATIALKDSNSYAWSDSSIESVDVNWSIEKASLTKPSYSGDSLIYTGKLLTFTPSGYNASKMSITGNTATDAGNYTAIISILDTTNYMWQDGTTTDVSISWSIEESELNYNISKVDDSTITISHVEDSTQYLLTVLMPSSTVYTVDQDTGHLLLSYQDTYSDDLEFTFSGTYYGSIEFSIGEENNGVLNLNGFTLTSCSICPINVSSAKNFDISAKSGTVNYIYDKRDESEDLSSAIYSCCDLKLKGSGTLTISSENNNGIHSKDDLEVQKITLSVNCVDNALKGNDSVTIHSGTITLISRQGDGIKTSNSSLYSSDSTQKGTVTIEDGTITIYSACDGIDATYNVEVLGGTLNIYTDKYSEYSEEVTTVTSGTYYIKTKTSSYKYSIYYYNTTSSGVWVNSSSYTTQSSMGRTYYYYQMDKPSGYSYLKVYIYSSSQSQGQSSSYYTCSSALAVNESYDTIYYNNSSFSWTSYTTSSSGMGMGGPSGQGGGQMEEGNTDKGEYSTKGIKADNEINISGGTIFIKSYDDGLHTNNDVALESGSTPTGNINISGGNLTVYSNDDGIHGDGIVTISGDDTIVSVTNSYEGVEGAVVKFTGGNVSIVSSDDGVNGTNTSGESIIVSGGYLYVNAGGDGLDSNSTSSYDGMLISGGYAVVISSGQSDSSLDTENGYTYTGGYVVGIGRSGGMGSEATKASNFSSIGKSTTISLTQGNYLTVSGIVSVKMPTTLNALVVVLGSTTASVSSSSSSSLTFDGNVSWIA